MRSIVQLEQPDLLQEPNALLFSNTFIADFVHEHLNWSYRKSTSVAQKLPEDYKEQISRMNQIIAVTVISSGQVTALRL